MKSVTFGFILTSFVMMFYVSTQSLTYKEYGNETNFSFENCNRSAVPFFVKSLNLYPDPIDLQAAIYLKVEFNLDRDVGVNGSRIELDLNLRLKTDRGYTELCGIIGEKNCHNSDLCPMLVELMKHANRCPKFMKETYHNNCSCPFLKNEYHIPSVLVGIPPVLPFEIRGTFDLTVNLQEQGTHLGCIRVEFCITDCKPLGG